MDRLLVQEMVEQAKRSYALMMRMRERGESTIDPTQAGHKAVEDSVSWAMRTRRLGSMNPESQKKWREWVGREWRKQVLSRTSPSKEALTEEVASLMRRKKFSAPHAINCILKAHGLTVPKVSQAYRIQLHSRIGTLLNKKKQAAAR